MNTDADLRWYCLRARLKREHFAAARLSERTGVEAFAPRLLIRRGNRRGTFTSSVEALFPGYVFARFRLAEDTRFVASTADITGLVRFGAHTPPVPDDLIALFRTHASSAAPRSPLLAVGDWIEVLSGCLAGNQGRLVELDFNRDRAAVLLALLGQDLRISLPAAALRRTGADHLDFPPPLLAACG